MKLNTHTICWYLTLGLALSMGAGPAMAKNKTITLMQLQDVHGHIAPHAAILKDEVMDPNSGGMAKLATLIKQVRADNPNNLLLAVGDTTHGSAEMLFTLGDAIMPMMNALEVDAFLPGNWDFGWGSRVYRQRFTPNTAIELAPNNRTAVAWMDGRPGQEGQSCNTPGALIPYADCHVTKANFPTVAVNLYNYNEVTRTIRTTPANPTGRTHKPYILKDVGYGYPVYQHSVINISHDMESLLLGLYTVLTLSRHALGKQRLHGVKQLWHVMRLRPEIHMGETVNEKQLHLTLRQGGGQCDALGIGDQIVTASMQQDDVGP